MKEFGAANPLDPSMLLHLIAYLFTNPWIYLGVGFLVCSLCFYLIAISWLDLSYVLPIHSLTYVLNAFLAWSILGEAISPMRWFSTLIISVGVLLVGLSQSQPPTVKPRKKSYRKGLVPLILFPFGIAISKIWLAVIILVLADSSGDILLAMGMKRVGKFTLQSRDKMLQQVGQIVTNPAIIGGVCGQGIAFAMFINLLSWADISFVRPLTALTYVFSMLGAKYILKETISSQRLLGIAFIITGVFIHQ
jgi:drug/metabolite transporter (DMT)-like permease